MHTFLARIVAAAALVLTVQGANAATSVTFPLDGVFESTRSIAASTSGKSFSHDYDFSLTAPSSFMGQVYSSSVPALNYGMSSLSLSLFELMPFGSRFIALATSPGYLFGTGPGSVAFDLTGLAQPLGIGKYQVTVFGDALTSGASYRLTLAVAPVPEPEVWAMLLAGLGIVSWRARRRNQ